MIRGVVFFLSCFSNIIQTGTLNVREGENIRVRDGTTEKDEYRQYLY